VSAAISQGLTPPFVKSSHVGPGPKRLRSAGQSMSALPGEIRRLFVLLSPAIMSRSQAAVLPFQAISFLLRVEKQNSYNRMTLKLVEDLYFSALECGFA